MSGYEQLYRRYTTTPMNMVVCPPGQIDVAGLGSVQFRMVSQTFIEVNSSISSPVVLKPHLC